MTDTGTRIIRFLMNPGKSAPDMTHALKTLGGDSMQHGLARIARYFTEEVRISMERGIAKGRIEGGVIGTLGGLAIGGITTAIIVNRKKKIAKHETEGRDILKTLETETAESDDVVSQETMEANLEQSNTTDEDSDSR